MNFLERVRSEEEPPRPCQLFLLVSGTFSARVVRTTMPSGVPGYAIRKVVVHGRGDDERQHHRCDDAADDGDRQRLQHL